jgi:hypothetical protein
VRSKGSTEQLVLGPAWLTDKLFLSNQNGKEEAEIRDTELMHRSDYNALSRFVLCNIPDATDTSGYFPNNHQIALRLESGLQQKTGSTLQASGYTASLPDASASSDHAFGNIVEQSHVT